MKGEGKKKQGNNLREKHAEDRGRSFIKPQMLNYEINLLTK